jgi:hypothetical protein
MGLIRKLVVLAYAVIPLVLVTRILHDLGSAPATSAGQARSCRGATSSARASAGSWAEVRSRAWVGVWAEG